MQNQAPGDFFGSILCSLYWKIVPFCSTLPDSGRYSGVARVLRIDLAGGAGGLHRCAGLSFSVCLSASVRGRVGVRRCWGWVRWCGWRGLRRPDSYFSALGAGADEGRSASSPHDFKRSRCALTGMLEQQRESVVSGGCEDHRLSELRAICHRARGTARRSRTRSRTNFCLERATEAGSPRTSQDGCADTLAAQQSSTGS
eukprot:COSAG02_NODE_1218_length_13814_cov_250.988844_13_plen_200_part_00